MSEDAPNVFVEIERQLAWRGPLGQPQKFVGLTRDQAAELLYVSKLIREQLDAMLAEYRPHEP